MSTLRRAIGWRAIKSSCVFDYHNYEYLHKVTDENYSTFGRRSMTDSKFLIMAVVFSMSRDSYVLAGMHLSVGIEARGMELLL